MDKTKILITGATGFLGSHLLKYLIKHTDYCFVVLKRSFSNTDRIKDYLSSDRIEYINIDTKSITKINWDNIKIIIHCATNYGRNHTSCYKVLESNLMFPIELIENAIKNNVKLFINTDSYFNKEHLSYQYLLNYSLSKKSLNLWLKYFSKNIKIINMILEHIYGEYDNPEKFVEQMIQDIAIKQVESIDLTPGEQKRDFIYIEDVCKMYLDAIKYSYNNDFTYKSFDIGTGIETSVKTFVETIKKLSKSKTKLNFGAKAYREDEIMSSVAKKRCIIGFDERKPKTTILQGIRTILNTYNKEKNG